MTSCNTGHDLKIKIENDLWRGTRVHHLLGQLDAAMSHAQPVVIALFHRL